MTALFFALIIASFLSIAYFVVTTLIANKKLDFRWRFVVIMHTYIGVILVYTAIYFCFVIIGDQQDSQEKNNYYSMMYNRSKTHLLPNQPYYQIPRLPDQRALKGVTVRTCTSVVNPDFTMLLKSDLDTIKYQYDQDHWSYLYDYYTNGDKGEPSIELIFKLIERNAEYPCRFLTKNVWLVANDCLYFSISTIATVGYGDISPGLWYIKLISASEALFGTLIFVLSINFLFADYSGYSTVSKTSLEP